VRKGGEGGHAFEVVNRRFALFWDGRLGVEGDWGEIESCAGGVGLGEDFGQVGFRDELDAAVAEADEAAVGEEWRFFGVSEDDVGVAAGHAAGKVCAKVEESGVLVELVDIVAPVVGVGKRVGERHGVVAGEGELCGRQLTGNDEVRGVGREVVVVVAGVHEAGGGEAFEVGRDTGDGGVSVSFAVGEKKECENGGEGQEADSGEDAVGGFRASCHDGCTMGEGDGSDSKWQIPNSRFQAFGRVLKVAWLAIWGVWVQWELWVWMLRILFSGCDDGR